MLIGIIGSFRANRHFGRWIPQLVANYFQFNITHEMMLKMNTELYNENFEVLHKKFYPKWIAQVRSKIPADYNISDNEIVSEITVRCLELAEKFKGGFFPSYCDLYVVCEVVKRLYKEYKKLDHSLIADAYRDWEEGEDYVQHHQYIEYVDT